MKRKICFVVASATGVKTSILTSANAFATLPYVVFAAGGVHYAPHRAPAVLLVVLIAAAAAVVTMPAAEEATSVWISGSAVQMELASMQRLGRAAVTAKYAVAAIAKALARLCNCC